MRFSLSLAVGKRPFRSPRRTLTADPAAQNPKSGAEDLGINSEAACPMWSVDGAVRRGPQDERRERQAHYSTENSCPRKVNTGKRVTAASQGTIWSDDLVSSSPNLVTRWAAPPGLSLVTQNKQSLFTGREVRDAKRRRPLHLKGSSTCIATLQKQVRTLGAPRRLSTSRPDRTWDDARGGSI